MIEQFVKDPLFLDVIHPLSPDFCLYWQPSGDLLTYGWNFAHVPIVGSFLVWQQDGDRGAWIERSEQSSPKSDADRPVYRIDRIDVMQRERPELNPDGVQRLHWIYLADVLTA